MNELQALISNSLWVTLLIGIAYSPIQMALMQKIKLLPIIKSSVGIWVANLITSIAIGYFFSYTFYTDLIILERIWVGLFAFLGAIGLYELFKASSIIPYTPRPMPEKQKCIAIENKIDYNGGV